MTRFVTVSRLRRGLATLSASVFLAGQALSQGSAPVVSSPDLTPELRLAAREMAVGNWASAYKAGQLAFRTATTDEQRFHAARIASVSAFTQGYDLRTRFWLRRAGDVAPTDVARNKVLRNFKLLQAKSLWRWHLDLSVRHSSNVNGGADSPFNIIEGLPVVGIISGSGQALSGTVAQGRFSASRRIGQTKTSQTHLTFSGYARFISLSDDARDLAPEVSGGDFRASDYLVGLRHIQLFPDSKRSAGLSINFGQNFRAGERSYDKVETRVWHSWSFGKSMRLTADASVEKRFYPNDFDGEAFGAGLSFAHVNKHGNKMTASIGLRDADEPNPIFDSQGVTARLGYKLGKPVGPLRIGGSIGASFNDYSNFQVAFFDVPGGRQDETVFADLNIGLTNMSYAGFSPELKIRAIKTDSNVSRFTTEQVSVSLGLHSEF